MIRLHAPILTGFLILVIATTLTYPASRSHLAETCQCSAPDGSCEVTITCSGGCQSVCNNDEQCYAECSGFYGVFGREVTLDLHNGTYAQLVAELARISGKEVTFSPTKPDAGFNATFKRAILWDTLRLLSDRGTLRVGGTDFEKLKALRKLLLSGTRLSFSVKNTPVNTFVSDMSALTGIPMRITAGPSMATANIELENVNLDDIIAAVSQQTDTTIVMEWAAEKTEGSREF